MKCTEYNAFSSSLNNVCFLLHVNAMPCEVTPLITGSAYLRLECSNLIVCNSYQSVNIITNRFFLKCSADVQSKKSQFFFFSPWFSVICFNLSVQSFWRKFEKAFGIKVSPSGESSFSLECFRTQE